MKNYVKARLFERWANLLLHDSDFDGCWETYGTVLGKRYDAITDEEKLALKDLIWEESRKLRHRARKLKGQEE